MNLSIPVPGEGRVPPHDLEAEASVLGSILLDPTAISRVLEVIQPEDFYRENNGQIYRAAIGLFREGEPIDLVTLGDQLQKQGVLERVGGRAHLATLLEQTPTAANVEYYGRIVKGHAYKRALISAGGEVTALGYNDALEAEEALNTAQAKVFSIAEQRTGSGLERLYDLLKPAMDRIDAQMATGGGVVGVPSGFGDLDRLTNGFKASDMIVVAARPSMGKTSFVLNITLHAAIEHKLPVAIFSLEMSKEQLVERMLCEQARIDAQRLHRGMLSENEHERLVYSLGPLGDAPIFIDDSPILDDLSLRLKARQAAARDNVQLIIVDYLQLMHGRSAPGDPNRVQEVSQISRSMKAIARELRVPLIACSQLSRAPEQRPDKHPILSDLRESGCMPAGTRLLRADNNREVTLGDLVLSQEQPLVWSLDDRCRLAPRRLLRTFPSGVRATFRLRLASGAEVEATGNHRFRTVEGWRPLDDLRPGTAIATPRRLPDPVESNGDLWNLDVTGARDQVRFLTLVGCHGARGAVIPERLQALGFAKPNPNVNLVPRAVADATSEVLWDEVLEISPLGEQPVFDATVEGTHNFIANGIVAHNSIEQDADLVMFLYRDDYYNREKSEKPGVAEVIIAKHRNGPTGSIDLRFIRELTRFENIDRRHSDYDAGF